MMEIFFNTMRAPCELPCENVDVSHGVPLFYGHRTSHPVSDTMVLIVRPTVANVLCGTVTVDQVTRAPQLPLFEAQPN